MMVGHDPYNLRHLWAEPVLLNYDANQPMMPIPEMKIYMYFAVGDCDALSNPTPYSFLIYPPIMMTSCDFCTSYQLIYC